MSQHCPDFFKATTALFVSLPETSIFKININIIAEIHIKAEPRDIFHVQILDFFNNFIGIEKLYSMDDDDKELFPNLVALITFYHVRFLHDAITYRYKRTRILAAVLGLQQHIAPEVIEYHILPMMIAQVQYTK